MEGSQQILLVQTLFCTLLFVTAQRLYDSEIYKTEREPDILTWCTVNREEQYKCGNLSMAVMRDRQLFGSDYFQINCTQGFDKDECMSWLSNDKADITGLDSGEVFVAGRFHSLVPFMQELQQGALRYVYSVAVVKRDSKVGEGGLKSLRGAKACFPFVGSFAGWVLPIKTLMAEGGLEIIDCNNHIKSVINFFGSSCAPNCLLDKNNPIGDNSDKLCQICAGKVGVRCSAGDPYVGFLGAFRCLLEAGEIAFLKHSTISNALTKHSEFSTLSSDKFELLCKDGSRRPITDFISCNWGTAPSDALVTTTAKSNIQIKQYQKFLEKVVQFYSSASKYDYNSTSNGNRQGFNNDKDAYGNPINRDEYGNSRSSSERDRFGNSIRERYGNPINRDPYGNPINRDPYGDRSTIESSENDEGKMAPIEKFEIFDSIRYGIRTDLMFEDATVSLLSLGEEKQSYSEFLGQSAKSVLEIRSCPIGRFTLCVTSEPELKKCVKMRTAMKAQLLKPDLVCYKGLSQINCMQAIRAGSADGVMLDAADVWEAARHFDLQPILAEVYGLGQSYYYAVAVAKEQDDSTELTYLKGKNTCHSGINTAAGWMYPLAYLLANGWIRPYGCDAARAAAEWFSRSCVPGAMSSEYNMGVPHAPLCRLCHGSTTSFCKRDATESYYGNIGAIRCLMEGGGDVAFVSHSAVAESAGGRKQEWWARNTLRDDYQLLCPDGTRGSMADYKTCNLGKVPANAMVTRGGEGTNETEIAAFINLFMYAQQFYGTLTDDDFSFNMFASPSPYFDLIFSDGTRQLKPLMDKERRASTYLGRVFMRAHHLTDCAPTAGARSIVPLSYIMWLLSLVSIFVSFTR